jgi:hypothetical protein
MSFNLYLHVRILTGVFIIQVLMDFNLRLQVLVLTGDLGCITCVIEQNFSNFTGLTGATTFKLCVVVFCWVWSV